MTDSQINDLERREKLRQLRAQEDHTNENHLISPITSTPFPLNSVISPVQLTSISANHDDNDNSLEFDENTSVAPDLLKDHIDSEHVRVSKKV